MLTIKNNHGQGMVLEYAITFFLVVAFVSSMSMYVRRTVQARVHGAAKYVQREVGSIVISPSGNIVGKYQAQYEPYYTNTQSERRQYLQHETGAYDGGQHGIYFQKVDDITIMQTHAIQTSPVNAD